MQGLSDRTLLMATYVIPGAFDWIKDALPHDSLIKHQWVIALHNVFLVSDSSTKMADTGDGDQRISSEIDGTYSKFSGEL